MSAGALTDEEVLNTLSHAQHLKESDESKLESLRDGEDGYVGKIAEDIEKIEGSIQSTSEVGGVGIALLIAGVATTLNPEIGQAIGSYLNDAAATSGVVESIAQGFDQVVDYIDDALVAAGSLIGVGAVTKIHLENQDLEETKQLHTEVSERAELLNQVLEGESIDLSSVEQKDSGENISPSSAISSDKGKSDISK